MDTPILRVVTQRQQLDCGIACLAMLLGRTYEEVLLVSAQVLPDVYAAGMTWRQLQAVAKRFGVSTKLNRYWERNPESCGALCVSAANWAVQHLVVLKDEIVVDPEDGTLWDLDVYLSVHKATTGYLLEFSDPS